MSSESSRKNRERFVKEREKRAEQRSEYEKQESPFDVFETMKELWGNFIIDTSTEEDIAFEEAMNMDEKLEEIVEDEEEYGEISTFSEALEYLKESGEYEEVFGHKQDTEIANEEFIKALGNKLEQLLENNNFDLAHRLTETFGEGDWLSRGKVEPTEDVSSFDRIEEEMKQELYSVIQRQIREKIDNAHQLKDVSKDEGVKDREELLNQLEKLLNSFASFIFEQIQDEKKLKHFLDNIEPDSFGPNKEGRSKEDFWRSQDEQIARKFKKFIIPVEYNDNTSYTPSGGPFFTTLNILSAYDSIFNDASEDECRILDMEETDKIDRARSVNFYNN